MKVTKRKMFSMQEKRKFYNAENTVLLQVTY